MICSNTRLSRASFNLIQMRLTNTNSLCYEGEVHGYENLEQAFVHSCNGAFAQIGMEVNNDSYRKLCESFLFNKDLPIDLPSSQSLFRLSSNASYGEEMMTAIGQGETVVSPFEMALVAATVATFIVALVAMDGWERVTELAEKLIKKG